MLIKKLSSRIAISAAVWIVLFFAGRTLSAQSVINVPADQATIQAAIDAANNGDTVLVAPGSYQENITFRGKAITVASSDGASVTIIDGGNNGSVVTFNTGEGANSVLRGFTIQHGKAQFEGGGILIDSTSPAITGNIIQNNAACSEGGGIAALFSAALIQGNTVQNNTQAGCSGGEGGGIAVGGAGSTQVIGNVIINNTWPSGDGGGIALNAAGTPTISNNVISGNVATGVFPASEGGGIFIGNVSDALIVQNLIYNNSAGQGGEIYFGVPSVGRGPILVNNTIVDNSSAGAVFATGFDSQVQFFNNLIIELAAGQSATVCDGTFNPQPPIFTNNDAFSATGAGLSGTCASQAGQNGNISVDPQFVNAAAGDFHLQATSPAIDAGDNSAADLPSTDYARNPRVLDGNNDCVSTVDLGVHEFVLGAANVRVSSSSLTFPTQVIGTASNPQVVTLSNSGTACFQFSNVHVSGDFGQTNGCAAAGVPGGSSCSYNVTFTPVASGPRTGALTVTGSDGVNTTSPSVALNGVGQTAAAASLSPTTLIFGGQPVGTASTPQIVTLTNTGQASLIITGISATAPFAQTNTCPASLAGGASCSISVSFAPTGSGSQSGTLSISDNAGGSPQTITLSGTGVDFSVSATPTSVTIRRGESAGITIAVSPVGGPFGSTVSLSCSGLPAAASCPISPASVTPGANGSSSLMTLATHSKTPRGQFNVTVIAQSGALQHTTVISLTVR